MVFKDREGSTNKKRTKTHLQCPKTEPQIRQCQMVFSPDTHLSHQKDQEYENSKLSAANDFLPAHNLHVAREIEHDHQMRLRKLHQFLYDEMTERDQKIKSDRSKQIFKERKKKAIFLNYDLQYVSREVQML